MVSLFFPKFPPLFEDSRFWFLIFYLEHSGKSCLTFPQPFSAHFGSVNSGIWVNIGQFEMSMLSFQARVRQNKVRDQQLEYELIQRWITFIVFWNPASPKTILKQKMINLCIETTRNMLILRCLFCRSEDLLSGFVAGCAAATANNPFDVIKTRQQAGWVQMWLGMEMQIIWCRFSRHWTFEELDDEASF